MAVASSRNDMAFRKAELICITNRKKYNKKYCCEPKDKFGMTTPAGLKSRMSVWRVLPCRLELTRLILYGSDFMQYQAVLCQYT